MMSPPEEDMDPEIMAIAAVFNALKVLEPDEQSRVLDYVQRKLDRQAAQLKREKQPPEMMPQGSLESKEDSDEPNPNDEVQPDDHEADESGINAVALKWMQRNGLSVASLGALFSLGLDDIELVAKTIPGKTKKERLHSVALLKGIAAYLGSGTTRLTHAELKETCVHYDAYDAANLAVNMKSFASEIGGNAKQGYNLTARGLAAATELVKNQISPQET